MKKKRLDLLLVERGLVTSREKARGLVMAGQVLVDDEPVEKCGVQIGENSSIRLRGDLSPFVGRGGDKLAGALDFFHISPRGQVVLDIGASTGGFTDCLLQRGAVKVYAVDVGYNQLHDRLRRDPRVVVMEKRHAKDLTAGHFEPMPSMVTVDVSFISAAKILTSIASFLLDDTTLVVLVKPQFEVGPEYVEKGGVVSEQPLQLKAVESLLAEALRFGYHTFGVCPSVLRGAKKGNQEYFVLLSFRPVLL